MRSRLWRTSARCGRCCSRRENEALPEIRSVETDTCATPSLREALATRQSRLSPQRDSGFLRCASNDRECGRTASPNGRRRPKAPESAPPDPAAEFAELQLELLMFSDSAALPRPTTSAERIDAIDLLRGIALFGVMAINIVMEFRISIFAQFLGPKALASPVDRVIETILTQAVELKAFALFSLLFGAGLAIQFDRLANSERRTVLLARRLAVLLVFGVIHLC